MQAPEPVAPRVLARFRAEPDNPIVRARFVPGTPSRPLLHATFKPEAWERAERALVNIGLRPPFPPAPTAPPLTVDQQLLYGVRSLLSPDNYQIQNKYVTAQLSAGQAYDYQIPAWARHVLLTNRSAGSAAAGQLYYWYDLPQQGAKVLPPSYATLTAGQSISENSEFAWLTLFADATCTDEGWEIRFSGRPVDALGSPHRLVGPVRNAPPSAGSPPGAPGGAGPSAPPPSAVGSPGLVTAYVP